VYWLYSLISGTAFLLLLPVYFVKLRLIRGEPLRAAERLSLRRPPAGSGRPLLWIHAVSVGEILSLQSLLGVVRASYPGWEVGCSTLTNAGYAVAREKLTGVDRLFLVPADVGWCVRRVFKRLRPALLVLVESEFWPRLLREAERRRCPVLLVNGRISERSFVRLRRYRALAKRVLRKISRFLVQTPLDRERLLAVGVDGAKIEVSGNLKCDVRLPELGPSDVSRLRGELGIGPGRRTVVAGSIHPGEEGLLLGAFRKARRERDDILLVLAPRHPDKFAEIEKEFAGGDLVLRRRTKLILGEPWDVLLLDTIGELAKFYALSDAAFIGGSLVPHGGQNLLEPAFYGKAVFFGPSMHNFADLAEAFLRAGAAKVVEKPDELVEVFLFRDAEAVARMGSASRTVLESLQGATARTLAALRPFMGKPDA
jgi:3-deoxy-D-manno-octulosonic-acid transferase